MVLVPVTGPHSVFSTRRSSRPRSSCRMATLLTGYLKKQPVGRTVGQSHRRWIVLTQDRVLWYRDIHSQSPNGELRLLPHASAVTLKDGQLTVVSGKAELILFDTTDGHGGHSVAEWAAAIDGVLTRLKQARTARLSRALPPPSTPPPPWQPMAPDPRGGGG